MDYHIENKILLSEDSEYKGLYSWLLQEFNGEGEKIGCGQIPWWWGLYFTASELRHHYSVNIRESINDEDEKSTAVQEGEVISAILHPGFCCDGESLKKDVTYSMFGTNRTIKEFTLRIQRIEDGSDNREEFCDVWGCVSYTSECDFRYTTIDDTIQITLRLLPQRFSKIAELIKTQRVDILELYLSGVSGFYSEWSPSITTGSIKVLAAQEEDQMVVKKDGCKIDPPRLGSVSEFDLRITQRHKLNLKQDLRRVNTNKLFYGFDDASEEPVEEEEPQETQNDKASLMLSQLARNETVLNQLRTSIWLIFIVLCIFLIKGWF